MKNQPTIILEANDTLLGNRNLEEVETYFSPRYVAHLTGKDMSGLSWVRRAIGMLHKAFPDLTVDVEVLLEHGDRIAWQRTLRGTHEASYAGFPGSGKRIEWRDMVTSRTDGGLIVEEWVVTDLAEQLLRSRKK